MHRLREKSNQAVEKVAVKTTHWIGSTGSLIVHTFLFAGAFVSYFFNVPIDDILLVLTTIVSLEAIYLSIFIQMSVNRQNQKLHDVAEDVEDIQEDVDEIQKDVDEIQEDVDEIQKDVDEIQEDVEDIQEDDDEEDKEQKRGDEMMVRIEETLGKLIEEVMDLKKQHVKQSKSKKSDK
jgi:peptidoglycan hydrolase CwlO-like protein